MLHKKQKKFSDSKKGTLAFLSFCILLFAGSITLYGLSHPIKETRPVQTGFDDAKIASCNKSPNKSTCIESVLLEALHKGGVEASLDTLKHVYERDPQVASTCHFFTHFIGQQAYMKFKNNEQFALTPKTSYCGFGFYHGFMEALFRENGSIEEARKFCYFADKSLSNSAIRPSTACFHGIGHGAVDGSEITAWGNSQELLEPALNICEKLPNEKEQYECASGAFNSLAIAYSSHSYGLKGNENNPFYDCTLKKDSYYHHACYEEMNTYVLTVTKNELLPALRFAEMVNSDTDAIYAAQNIGGAYAQRMKTRKDFDKAADACQKVQERLTSYCITGIVGGLFEFGRPGMEHEHPIAFCNSTLLTQENRTLCFNKLTEFLKGLFSKERTIQICQSFPSSYRYICQK